jgi:hypothetical protein
MPSIVVVARNADGTPRPDVRAVVDGVVMTERLSAEPITLDPGEHVLVLFALGVGRIEQRFTLREGERVRRIEVTLVTQPGFIGPTPKAQHEAERPVPPLTWILGGIGLVSAGVGSYFQVSGMTGRADLYECAPRCMQRDVDAARRDLWIGNVSIGASVVSLAAAAIVYFTRPTITRSAAGAESALVLF